MNIFEPTVLSQIIQMIVTIVSTVGALWALISKKDAENKAYIKRIESKVNELNSMTKENLSITKAALGETEYYTTKRK